VFEAPFENGQIIISDESHVGQLQGLCLLIKENGDTYNGIFDHGVLVFGSASTEKYKGTIKNDEYSGKGSFYYCDDNKYCYSGDW
jgi:hypothetical protein